MLSKTFGRQVGAKTHTGLKAKFFLCIASRKTHILVCASLIIIAMTIGILVVCFTIQKTSTKCQSTFQRMMNSSIITSSQPKSIAIGDINNDHYEDIVVANSGTNTIGIFIAKYDGTFKNQETLTLESDSRPYSIVITDFNNDNYLDIAIANYGTHSIGIFLGNGNGTFLDQKLFSTGSSRPVFITTGDFNRDNNTDIVIANNGTNNIGIMYGYGNGLFQEQITYSTGYDSSPYMIAVGYLNNDNYLDIAVANYGTDNIGILFGYGNKTFADMKTYTTNHDSNPSSIVFEDFDNDNQLDIAVTTDGTSSISILFNYGNGTFLAPVTYTINTDSYPQCIATGNGNGSFVTITTYDTTSGSSPIWIAVADFNNDNQSDIVVANYDANNVLILMNYSMKPSTRQSNYHVAQPNTVGAVVVSDLNNDHIFDLICIVQSIIYIRIGLRDGSFDVGVSYLTSPTGTPKYLCVEDLNKDNRMDIISVNSGSDSIGVFLGYGNGTLGTMVTYSTGVGSNPHWATLGDINNDNRWDIISANTGTNSVGILLGNQNGTFDTMIFFSTGIDFNPSSVAVGTVNNDTYLDIVVANSKNAIAVFLGYGNGTFHIMSMYSTGTGSNPFSVTLIYLNTDNYLDIVVTNTYASSVGVFLGYGNGTFTTQTPYSTGSDSTPYFTVVADFNNDNIYDLAITNQNKDEIIILYGNNNGSFELARQYSTGSGSNPYGITVTNSNNNKQLEIVVSLYGTGDIALITEYYSAEFTSQKAYSTISSPKPYSVAVGDFNNDNRSDIVVANSQTDNFDILLSSNKSAFDKKTTYSIDTGSQPQYVITGDIDKDNQLDIISVYSKTNYISLIRGYGNGSFANQKTYSTGSGSEPHAIVYDDFNNDRRWDFAVVNAGSNTIGIFYGFNYTTYENQTTYSNIPNSKPTGMIIHDFNNDTVLDIAVVFSNNDSFGILFGHGNGSFTNTMIYSIGNGSQPCAIAAGDVNNDGHLDIVVVNKGINNIGILLGYNNNGNFSMINMYSTGQDSAPNALVVEDFNNDSRLDIAVANYGTDNIAVLRGYGNGNFSIIQMYSTEKGSTPHAIVPGDFDEDGVLDIVVACYSTSTIEILRGYGNGTFGNKTIFSLVSNSQPWWIAIGYFNKDNHLDLAIANYGSNHIGIVFGNGKGTFTTVKIHTTGPGSLPTCISVNDFNNDNQSDIAVTNFGTNEIVILFGFGDGTFLSGTAYSTGTDSSPYALAVGDFNNDAQLDIAVTNSVSNNIGIFLAYDSDLFASMSEYATGPESKPYSIATGDFNNDNQSDIIVANYGANNVRIFNGSSKGISGVMTTYQIGNNSAPYSVAVGHFNNDSYLDFVVSNSGTDNIAIILGFGNGTFTLGMTYSTGDRSRPYTVGIGDFDNNKISDIVVANSGTSKIFLVYGYENGTFGNDISYALGYGYHPYSVVVTDINQDNWLDIVIACYDADSVEILIKTC